MNAPKKEISHSLVVESLVLKFANDFLSFIRILEKLPIIRKTDGILPMMDEDIRTQVSTYFKNPVF